MPPEFSLGFFLEDLPRTFKTNNLVNRYTDWLDDPWISRVERPALDIETTVLVVGGGFSGIQVAGNLKKAGINDFKIMERGGDFGGTWVSCEDEHAARSTWPVEVGRGRLYPLKLILVDNGHSWLFWTFSQSAMGA